MNGWNMCLLARLLAYWTDTREITSFIIIDPLRWGLNWIGSDRAGFGDWNIIIIATSMGMA